MGQSSSTPDRQRYSTPDMQRQIATVGEARKPVMADAQVIRHCEDLLDAVRLAVHMSNYSHEHICGQLGIDKGHWSRIMQGRAHFPTNKFRALMELSGSLAPLQFLAYSMGYTLEEVSRIEDQSEVARELSRRVA